MGLIKVINISAISIAIKSTLFKTPRLTYRAVVCLHAALLSVSGCVCSVCVCVDVLHVMAWEERGHLSSRETR